MLFLHIRRPWIPLFLPWLHLILEVTAMMSTLLFSTVSCRAQVSSPSTIMVSTSMSPWLTSTSVSYLEWHWTHLRGCPQVPEHTFDPATGALSVTLHLGSVFLLGPASIWGLTPKRGPSWHPITTAFYPNLFWPWRWHLSSSWVAERHLLCGLLQFFIVFIHSNLRFWSSGSCISKVQRYLTMQPIFACLSKYVTGNDRQYMATWLLPVKLRADEGAVKYQGQITPVTKGCGMEKVFGSVLCDQREEGNCNTCAG